MSKERFFDIGANLTHPAFSEDLSEVIDEAIEVGVNRMCITGSDLEDSKSASELALSLPEIFVSTAGIHPHQAKTYSQDSFSEIKSLLELKQVKAIGETGLDFYRDFSSRKDQIRNFEAHIEASIDLNIPMFLHVREAHKKFIEVLKPNQNSIPKAVVHCFTGTKKELVEYIDMDLYIGITGWLCDERRGTHLKDLIQLIPIDRIMAETDSPYLVPRNLNSIKTRRNEPKFLPHIVEEIVSNLDRSKSSIISSIYMNSLNFFNIYL